MKNGVATLMHLPKGHVWKLEPLLTYKNAPRQRRVHSYIVSGCRFRLPLLLNRTYSKLVFQTFSVSAK